MSGWPHATRPKTAALGARRGAQGARSGSVKLRCTPSIGSASGVARVSLRGHLQYLLGRNRRIRRHMSIDTLSTAASRRLPTLR